MALTFAKPDRRLDITVDRTGRHVTVAAAGRIDLATETPWHDQVMHACTATDDTTRVTVDLTEVTFLSWASTAVLLRAHRACQRRGRALRVLACGPVLTGLHLTRLHEDITVTPTLRPVQSTRPRACSGWLIA
ncbi:STAS domain-containing protein [Actinokineospora cianjurensis]|uniref:Anti-anti-sigma factor n=1 Tax=Actinokineospora cianjurensis TaxID=585224 RepID=A0A421B2L1_9PSEU|nr:STAS domain-containing protein [Actinokineospora cianjurensis]RLK58617.1 anti-anti-sigma factor [Actinokineospora cianjurensis]